jgi:flagellar biosynthesis/type III secretory pathway protein FliH
MGIRFPTAKLIDYNKHWRTLQRAARTNPFAVVVMAYLKAQATQKDPDGRLRAKLSLIRRLYESGYERQQIEALFKFVDWVMRLPEEYERELRVQTQQLETEKKMAYVTSWERLAKAEGVEEGIQEGIQKGIQKGKAASLRRQLEQRFGELPQWAESRLEGAKAKELDHWSDRILDAGRLVDVFLDSPQTES